MKEEKEENDQESRSSWGGESSNGFSEDLVGEGERICQKRVLSFP